jgi:hypothetical protein
MIKKLGATEITSLTGFDLGDLGGNKSWLTQVPEGRNIGNKKELITKLKCRRHKTILSKTNNDIQ